MTAQFEIFEIGLTKEQRKAVMIAVEAVKERRRKYFACSASLADYITPPPDFAVRAKKQWDELTEVASILEAML